MQEIVICDHFCIFMSALYWLFTRVLSVQRLISSTEEPSREFLKGPDFPPRVSVNTLNILVWAQHFTWENLRDSLKFWPGEFLCKLVKCFVGRRLGVQSITCLEPVHYLNYADNFTGNFWTTPRINDLSALDVHKGSELTPSYTAVIPKGQIWI